MRKLFKKIYNVVDKVIVLPISRFIYFLKKKLDKSRGFLDKWLNKPKFLIGLSLSLAIIMFLLIDYRVINLVESQSETISVPVVVKYNTEAYVVEGVPETVNIIISGNREHIYLAQLLGKYEVELDLTEYTASSSPYEVEFKYTKPLDNLSYKIVPTTANVLIHKKVSEIVPITHDYLNIDSLNPELSVNSVTLDKNEVVVKGSESALKEIATVKALIDLDNNNLTEAGTYSLTDVNLVAYDNSGNKLNNIEIVPGTIGASITLDSYSKSLPLQVKTTGSLIAGKAIAAIQINGKDTFSLTAFGDKDDLDKIDYIPLTIDVDELGKDSVKTYNVSLSKPSGVRHLSSDNVTISVTFGDEKQKSVNIGDKIASKNLGNGYSANIISDEDVNVQVKGVESVISGISAEDINAYVDLSGLPPGVHEVEVEIDNINPLVNYVVSSTITINITE